MPDSRYRITDKIAAGGMAEVFKGVAESLQGFRKNVAIKRVLPALTKNHKFITMFLDEARLSLFLQHANIVQVFDIGHADDTYFIVMEFVDGVDLKAIMEWRRRIGRRLTIGQTIYMIMEVCKGSAYAHDLIHPETGERLGIVHRDVSPANVLISTQRRDQAGRLRAGQGRKPGGIDRPRRGQGQDELSVARGRARRERRSARGHLFRRHPALRDADQQAAVLRRHRLPDGRAGAQREDSAHRHAEPRGRTRVRGDLPKGAGPSHGRSLSDRHRFAGCAGALPVLARAEDDPARHRGIWFAPASRIRPPSLRGARPSASAPSTPFCTPSSMRSPRWNSTTMLKMARWWRPPDGGCKWAASSTHAHGRPRPTGQDRALKRPARYGRRISAPGFATLPARHRQRHAGQKQPVLACRRAACSAAHGVAASWSHGQRSGFLATCADARSVRARAAAARAIARDSSWRPAWHHGRRGHHRRAFRLAALQR